MAAALARIPLVPPWTVDEFCGWVEESYGRQVILAPWQTEAPDAGEPGACGTLWVQRDSFIIKYDDTRSGRNQRQQIFHEVGHILPGHKGKPWRMSDTIIAEGFDPATVDSVMYRGIFDSTEERVAELLGTRLAVLSREQRGDGRFDRIASGFFEPVQR